MDRRDRRLDAAVSLGIISAAQAAGIRAIATDDDARPEAPRAVNAATLAYVLGAITVVVAMGWFLADRWSWLGAGGVLAVSLLYAALFLLVGQRLRAQGFPVAGGFGALLAVCMAPVATVAFNQLAGVFEPISGLTCHTPDFKLWTCRGEELLAELVTAAAALIALRQVRFPLLVLPLAGIALRFLFHASDAITRNELGQATSGWILVIGASLLAAAAYATDRRQRGDEDFALWLHFAAGVCAIVASVQVLNLFEELRHVLVPAAFVAFAAALLVRRTAWLVVGMAWFVWYLGWLAADVFKDSPLFPLILAALGIGVIAATVWVQRNAVRLVARFGAVSSDGRPRFPGGVPLLLSPVLVAALMLPNAAALDRQRRDDQEWWAEQQRLRVEREARARGDTVPGIPPPRETPPLRRP